MGKVSFKVLRDCGELSPLSGIYLRLIDWNGFQKWDIRRWDETGDIPYKGITIDNEEMPVFATILKEAINSSKPVFPQYSPHIGKLTAKILQIYGTFSTYGDMNKQVAYVDWGRAAKYDIRPWNEDYSACGKGISLSTQQCQKLIELIDIEFGEPTQYGISFEDFVVRSNVFRCNKNHELETIDAMISVLCSDGVVSNEFVTAGYCKVCGCYFILEEDYLKLRKKGLPLCRQVTEKYYSENGDSSFDGSLLNEQSILNQIGYTVNAADDLSSKQRQDILSFAVECGLYSVSGICSFLDWLIEKNSKVTNRDMRDAISKWREDRAFICNYMKGNRPVKGVRSLKGRSV